MMDHDMVPSTSDLHYLPRYWYFESYNYSASASFPSNVGVRLYFLNNEFQALKTAIQQNPIGMETNINTPMDLRVTHTTANAIDNCVPEDNDGIATQITPTGGPYLNGSYVEVSVGSFSEFAISGASNIVLPVELTQFYGQTGKSSNELFWETASETNNAYFEILKSINGYEFESIGRISGNGTTSSTNAYKFEDESPYILTYYQLKQVDKDGKSQLSGIIPIKREASFGFEGVWPNPSTGIFNIRMNAEQEESIQISIRNVEGKIIKSISVRVEEGENDLSFDLSGYTTGVYLIFIQGETSYLLEKVVLADK